MKSIVTFILISSSFSLFAQNNDLSIFKPLLNKKWVAEESWENGRKFKQEVVFKYKLEEKIVIAKTKGFTDEAQTKYGLRNYGIRQFDAATNKIKFWEHDVFGGVTEGTVYANGKDIFYEYNYDNKILTDKWEFINDSTYTLTIGSMHGDHWHDVYLKTEFHAKGIASSRKANSPDFAILLGTWTSKAWEGKLIETWKVGSDGHLHQKSKYLEKGTTKYESKSRIEWVGNDLILFSVIKDNDPKIFKATSITEDELIFENSEYKNPNKVVYTFKDNKTFHRTISGTENGKNSSYTFIFRNSK